VGKYCRVFFKVADAAAEFFARRHFKVADAAITQKPPPLSGRPILKFRHFLSTV
jgi:hypothetical protein